jgi:LPXTG-motif cell wall-anchored protein
MTPFVRFLLLPLATAFAGLVLSAAPSGAQTTGEVPVADPCVAVFADGASTNRNLQMQTNLPAQSEPAAGQEIRLDGIWGPTMWDSVTGLAACVEVADQVDPNLGGVEEPPVNDGSFTHAFNVPSGLVDGTVICTRIRLAGDPAGEATTGQWISRQACFEVHEPRPAPTPTTTPPTTAPPATSPTTTPPATTPTTAAPSSPTTMVANPAGTPAPAPAVVPEGPAQSTVSFNAPDEPAVSAETPRPRRPTAPVKMPELPRTGAPIGALALAGAAAVASGLPLVLLRRRR